MTGGCGAAVPNGRDYGAVRPNFEMFKIREGRICNGQMLCSTGMSPRNKGRPPGSKGVTGGDGASEQECNAQTCHPCQKTLSSSLFFKNTMQFRLKLSI